MLIFIEAPGPVHDIFFPKIESTAVNVKWSEPTGKFNRFEVVLYSGNNIIDTYETKKTNHDFKNLKPGTSYRITIVTEREETRSETVEETVTTSKNNTTTTKVCEQKISYFEHHEFIRI